MGNVDYIKEPVNLSTARYRERLRKKVITVTGIEKKLTAME
jgi:hypothetical protein